jgi:hypothetical protein
MHSLSISLMLPGYFCFEFRFSVIVISEDGLWWTDTWVLIKKAVCIYWWRGWGDAPLSKKMVAQASKALFSRTFTFNLDRHGWKSSSKTRTFIQLFGHRLTVHIFRKTYYLTLAQNSYQHTFYESSYIISKTYMTCILLWRYDCVCFFNMILI